MAILLEEMIQCFNTYQAIGIQEYYIKATEIRMFNFSILTMQQMIKTSFVTL